MSIAIDNIVAVVGFTKLDHITNYSPMLEGWKPGVGQDTVEVNLGNAPAMEPTSGLAELVFEASNMHNSGLPWKSALHAYIAGCLAGKRSLSVGDTVAFYSGGNLVAAWAVEHIGWKDITEAYEGSK
ncbi:MAG: hypothetical protein LBR20_06420 [Propionibacteriaceae bacterium]|nr:hypothetical protein [Propionibacteriaceae bacterium]